MTHPSPNGPRTGRPPAYASRGMVATSHALATGAGLDALRRGGSAADAAIAANAVLCVVYPHMAGLGGDGFWLCHHAAGGRVQALNASGPAAHLATRDWYREQGHTDAIPTRGGLAALTVPGAVDGWCEAHERFGRLPWDTLFADAIHLARHGIPVSRSLADWLVEDVPVLRRHERTAEQLLPGGRAMRQGDQFVLHDLAATFEQLATEGPRWFYDGVFAERFCAAVEDEGSPLRADDLHAFHAEWVEPISTTYRNVEAYEFPPNTQGFAALAILNLVEGYDVARLGDGTADYFHHLAEAVKLSFADRNAWLTDPRAVDIPVDRLIAKDYADERRRLIDPEHAMVMEEVEPGIAFDRGAFRHTAVGGDTVAFCAVDDDGLAVSVIQSVYHDFGAGFLAGDTGVIPQNRGSFFSLEDDHPNRLDPGKRTFHTLIPAMLLRDGRPYLAYGTMGGEGQPQTHAAIVTRLVDFGYDVQQAIEAPRWLMGRTWGAESQDLWLEGRVPDEVTRELDRRGQPVKHVARWNDNMGHAQAIRIHHDRGLLEGGADPRGDGWAAGW
jgi:gamma-glutamyltranspeptidase/glutathione hydrolase